jgi:hypothetical protein
LIRATMRAPGGDTLAARVTASGDAVIGHSMRTAFRAGQYAF